MNNKLNSYSNGEESIREVFTFIVNNIMFKTTANKEQFSKALEYVNIIGTVAKMQTLESVLRAGGFYISIKNEKIDDTFSI